MDDECRWFLRALDNGIVRFGECPQGCPRLKKYGVPGPDHFATPAGNARHLFSDPTAPSAWLSREYIPHIAAFAYAILEHGYDARACSFSRYRKFGRDLISKRAGGTYETDAEFYDDDAIHLQIEAKANPAETAALAAAIERHGSLSELPASAAKEIEYVLDLWPRNLWIVGPGSLDPPKYVYAVERKADKNAMFIPLVGLPLPPQRGA